MKHPTPAFVPAAPLVRARGSVPLRAAGRPALAAALLALAACSDVLPTAPNAGGRAIAPRMAVAPNFTNGRWTVATLFEYQGAGGRASAASSINEGGQVTGSYVVDGAGRAFRVTAGQQDVALLGGPGSTGVGINDAGQVAGREAGRPMRWEASGEPRVLTAVTSSSSTANAVNNGAVSVGSEFGGGAPTAARARRWAADGSVTQIAVPGTDLGFRDWSTAVDVNENGTVIVQASVEGRYDLLPFVWTEATGFTRMACPSNCPVGRGIEAAVHAINATGVVVGGVSVRGDQNSNPVFAAAVWNTPAAYQVIGAPGSRAYDVSDAGTVVGVGSNRRPAIWVNGQESDLLAQSCAAGGPAPLCAAGVTGVAQSLNERGQVVGYLEGLPDGAPRQAVVFTFVPTTGTGGEGLLRIRDLGDNLCLDIQGASDVAGDPGKPATTYYCHGGANQRVTFTAAGEARLYGDQCLDLWGAQGNDGDRVVLWPCHGGANQQWRRTPEGLVVGLNGKCLEVPGLDTTPGTPLVVWSCHGGANQKWDVVPTATP